MRGFDSSYPCIFNISVYSKLNKRKLDVTVRNPKNKLKIFLNPRLKLPLSLQAKTQFKTRLASRSNLRKLSFNRKTQIFAKKNKGVRLLKQTFRSQKRDLFKFLKFKRLRSRTFRFKKVRLYSFRKQSRLYTLFLKQYSRKKRTTRKGRTRKTRNHYIFSKIAFLRTRALNLYNKSVMKDTKLVKSLLPVNYHTLKYRKSGFLGYTYLQLLRKLNFIDVSYNFKKNKSVLKNQVYAKNRLYRIAQLHNNINKSVRKVKRFLKTSRLLRKRLTAPAMSGAFFKKYTRVDYTLNLKPKFLFNKGGFFNLNCFGPGSFTDGGLSLTFKQHWTNLWVYSLSKNSSFFALNPDTIQPQTVHLRYHNLTFRKPSMLSTPTQQLLDRKLISVVPNVNLFSGLNSFLAPALRYGDSTFYKKAKTSLRQLKQHLKMKNSVTPVNVSRLLDFREKAVTEASFTRINSDDTIFADTEFANVIARVYKLPVTHTSPLGKSLFFKNVYPFYHFLNKNLTHMRAKTLGSYNIKQPDTHKQFEMRKGSIILSKNLLAFLWKIKILKPKALVRKFHKHAARKINRRKPVQAFFTKRAIRAKYRYFHSRRFFYSFFTQQLSKWKVFFFSSKNKYFLKKRGLSNKLYSDRRHFKWVLPIKKNQKFFKRLELKINKDLRRKNVLYSYFKNKINIETKPILRKTRFTNYTRNSTFENFSQKPFLRKSTSIVNTASLTTWGTTSLWNDFSTFHLDYINLIFKNPFLLKTRLLSTGSTKTMLSLLNAQMLILTKYISSRTLRSYKSLHTTNLVPHSSFTFSVSRKIFSFLSIKVLASRVTPWYYNNIIRFIEDLTGRKVLFQFYPFMSQEVSKDNVVRYKKWLPRMSYYERRLGHRFFLEESLHILHLGFSLKDAVLICSWLKSMILRISFWKTKFIFRFLKYLFQNYFKFIFNDLSVKGLKIKLKGKISVAGNSRKRTILYRVGSTSHSSVDLRVVNHFQTINTFTGVMGLQVWVFY